MKNRIVTLLCILTILITTGIVAAQGRTADNFVNLSGNEDAIVQLLNGSDFPSGEYTKAVLVPGVNVDKAVTIKNVTGTNNSEGMALYVRTTFAFEAGDVQNTAAYDNYMHIEFNNSLADVAIPYWSYPDYGGWELIAIDGEPYYMVTATYYKQLDAGETTKPSLLNVGLESDVTNNIASQFGDEFKMYIYSEAATSLDSFADFNVNNHPWITSN